VDIINLFWLLLWRKNETKRKNSSSNKTKQNETKHQRYHLVCDNEINQIIFSEVEQQHGVNANIDLIHHPGIK
jgi:hypothetical protein